MEYCRSGDLLRYVLKNGAMPEGHVKRCIFSLVKAVRHLHSKKILHRDICLENLVIRDDLEANHEEDGLVGELREPHLVTVAKGRQP